MDVHIDRTDLHCEVVFVRPAFSQVTSFPSIIEPVYDAFDVAGFRVPADALRVENGDSIATAKVTWSLGSGLYTFEARLDGFEAHFLDLRSPNAIEHAAHLARLFHDTICEFLYDGVPARTTITMPTWLTVEGGSDAADAVVRGVALNDPNDPFRIGARTVPSQAMFTCANRDSNWTATVMIAKSQLPDTHLFLQVASEYVQGSVPVQFVDRTKHIGEIWSSVAVSLGLTVI